MQAADDDRRPFALVADDDPLILLDASSILEDFGFRMLEATTLGAAVKLLDEYCADRQCLATVSMRSWLKTLTIMMPGAR